MRNNNVKIKDKIFNNSLHYMFLGTFILLLGLAGCINGISYYRTITLKEKDIDNLHRFMKKHKIEDSYAYYLNEKGLVELFKNKIPGPASLGVLDSTGRVFTLYNDMVCSGRTDAFFKDELEESRLIPSGDTTLYRILSSSLFNFENKKIENFDYILGKSKYTVVIFWATYGKNNRKIKEWQSVINQDRDFQYITVNLDVNKNWMGEEIGSP